MLTNANSQVDVPMLFGGRQSPEPEMMPPKSRTDSRMSKSGSKAKSPTEGRSFRGRPFFIHLFLKIIIFVYVFT